MNKEELQLLEDSGDWNYLLEFLPDEWESKAYELGALRRCREFKDAVQLLRTMFIYLVDGCSMRETATRANQGGIANVNDTSLLRRLRSCSEWFRWMAYEIMQSWAAPALRIIDYNLCKKVRLVDATCISEPGSTGTDWRVHYSLDLPELRCHEFIVSDNSVGETFKNFKVEEGCLYIGDRGYSHRAGVLHIRKGNGHVIVRVNLTNFPVIESLTNKDFDILKKVRSLKVKQIGDWNVHFMWENTRVDGRICALRKSKAAAEQAQKEIIANSKKKEAIKPETLEAAGYVIVFTTLETMILPSVNILEMYRGRWQIEIAFKRLKSLLEIGHVPKKELTGAKAWIHGKLLSAILIEKLIEAGESFFPWGYPLMYEGNKK